MPKKQNQKQRNKLKSFSPKNQPRYQTVFHSFNSCNPDEIHSIANSVFGSSYYISYENFTNHV